MKNIYRQLLVLLLCIFPIQDKAAIGRHLANFREAIKSGQLILAGRTKEPGDQTFGIAIFEAKDEEAARKFMESDPRSRCRSDDGRVTSVRRGAATQESVT